MIYADHDGVRFDLGMLDEGWMELWHEQAEKACRLYGKGAAFVVESTHDTTRSYERKEGEH